MSQPNQIDEIQWRHAPGVQQLGSLHSNTILFYFSMSPFFEQTSNNAFVYSQAISNPNMIHLIATRENFENRLRSMPGLEFMVAEEPAESGPGMGTGVWVIRKQTRSTNLQDVTVHATYFVIGENIYMAPTFADFMAAKLMTVSLAIGNIMPAAGSLRKWRPSLGHTYNLPSSQPQSQSQSQRSRLQESKESTPMPGPPSKTTTVPLPQAHNEEAALQRCAEEAFMIHLRYGGEYIDENPITGRPGEFHLSSTGRKPVPPPQLKKSAIGTMNGPPAIDTTVGDKVKPKEGKTPKSATLPGKLKKRKSMKRDTPTPKAP